MQLKTVIDNSSAVKSLQGWLEAQKGIEVNVSEPIIINFYKRYPVEKLIHNNLPLFQRELQASRLKKIAMKVMQFGFLFIPIFVDENYKMVDGQHRIVVATFFGIDKVPVVVYKFKNQGEKARFFNVISMPEGGPPAIMDRLNARRIAKFPYESTIYRLIATDPESRFYDKVVCKGKNNVKTKIGLPCFFRIFNWIGLGFRRKWDQNMDGVFQNVLRSTDENGYKEMRQRLNDFADWLFSWAGSERQPGSLLYREKVLYGFLDFYLMMLHQAEGTQLNRLKKMSAKRFMTYELQPLMTFDITSIPEVVRKYYNKQRTTNRVESVEFDIEVSLISSREELAA